MESTIASGFSAGSARSSNTNNDITRQRSFANQMTVTNLKGHKPNYFVNTSNGLQASNPNTIRDMGATRNCEYRLSEPLDAARNVTWRDLAARDLEIDKII